MLSFMRGNPAVSWNKGMHDISEFKQRLEPALGSLLNHWRVWTGNDEIRALHIGFDCANAEIAVSLLTDREPYLEEQRLDPYGKRWPVADWRLTFIQTTGQYRFPDAENVLDWMARESNRLDTDSLDAVNRTLKMLLFEVATGVLVRGELARFRRVASPFKVRIEWFFDTNPLDAEFAI